MLTGQNQSSAHFTILQLILYWCLRPCLEMSFRCLWRRSKDRNSKCSCLRSRAKLLGYRWLLRPRKLSFEQFIIKRLENWRVFLQLAKSSSRWMIPDITWLSWLLMMWQRAELRKLSILVFGRWQLLTPQQSPKDQTWTSSVQILCHSKLEILIPSSLS